MQTATLSAQTALERRQHYLQESLRINEPRDHRHAISLRPTLQDSTWAEWQQRTGELPPDFSEMPSNPYLPEPLEWQGKQITSDAQWQQKREWIKEQFQYWVGGHRPPAPTNLQAIVLEEHEENGVRLQLIRLSFGPSRKAIMTFELMIPPGDGPFPVYMTQWNHRNWAQLALRRGYIACVYAGADSKDDTQAYQALYPDYDFTCLMRRAWGASRVVDYLMTRHEVNKKQIAITGHSRNGKQSLWAAAFDERITAVVTSSCGTGGTTPYRYSDPQYCTQTLDDIASNAAHWFQPRLRFFFGREDKLPIDQNLLLSLVAPRPLLIHYAIVERQISPWAVEQCFRSAGKVYAFMNQTAHLGILPRMGEHPAMTRDLERCLDFLDIQFGRSRETWHNKLYYTYNFEDWQKKSGQAADPRAVAPERLGVHKTIDSFEKQKGNIKEKLGWLLGNAPATVKSSDVALTTPDRMDWINRITGRPVIKNGQNLKIGPYTAMNNHLSGYLYCPDTTTHKHIPVIIYLHPYAYAHGSAYGYESFNSPNNTKLFQQFTDNGFAVLAIDMIGFGSRIEEGTDFYKRFPRWSQMGQMVEDVKSCVDAVSFFSFLNKDKIYIVGNTIGGATGLIATALDDRIKGIAAVAAFSPWRDKASGYSLDCYSKLNGFIPKLGYWSAERENVPVDFTEIIASIAPRPVLVISPQLDRHANPALVKESVEKARQVYSLYKQADNLLLSEPAEINRLTYGMVDDIITFLKKCN